MELTQIKQQSAGNQQQNDEFKRKINKLLQENQGLSQDVRGSQQALRLSTAQQNKLMQELTQFKEENGR